MTLENLLAEVGGTKEEQLAQQGFKSEDEYNAFLAENDAELNKLVRQLADKVLEEKGGLPDSLKDSIPANEVIPEPGFVIKTHNRTKVDDWPAGIKVFINVCHSPHIPAPPLASDEEIRRAINAEDNAAYKVPLSLSTPKTDKDKAAKMCLVFDACINTNPLTKANMDMDYKLFLIELSLEWIEEMYKLDLSREFSIPKMKSKGKLSKHIIRRAKRPAISEIGGPTKSTPVPGNSASSAGLSASEPMYKVTVTPESGKAELVQVDLRLPALKTVKGAVLDIEERRFLFTLPNQYKLDIPLPQSVNIDKGKAQFNRKTATLHVSLPCS
ncbi:pre-RNA processing PIH1/Nop17-domain-containing protein [Phlyctochytrium arcticum]|nr:pre-RNA processing PIH1/Nop17-domain-containing protein [Phlyctochytrium arcticum]